MATPSKCASNRVWSASPGSSASTTNSRLNIILDHYERQLREWPECRALALMFRSGSRAKDKPLLVACAGPWLDRRPGTHLRPGIADDRRSPSRRLER